MAAIVSIMVRGMLVERGDFVKIEFRQGIATIHAKRFDILNDEVYVVDDDDLMYAAFKILNVKK